MTIMRGDRQWHGRTVRRQLIQWQIDKRLVDDEIGVLPDIVM